MKAVDVFCGKHGIQNLHSINVSRQWKLDENPMHAAVLIQIPHEPEQLLLSRAFRKTVHGTLQPGLLTRSFFVANIHFTRRIMTDEHCHEVRNHLSHSRELPDFVREFRPDLFRDDLPVDYNCCHGGKDLSVE